MKMRYWRLKNTIGVRPLWLAASTHPGEEAMVANAHALLAATRLSNLLTIIVPRHPTRGPQIAEELRKNRIAWRYAPRSSRLRRIRKCISPTRWASWGCFTA